MAGFSSYIAEKEGTEFYEFGIAVHVSYKHFGGGSNGCSLFSVHGVIEEGSNHVLDLQNK